MTASPFAQKILDMLESKNHDAIEAMLAEDVIFRPPTYWADWQGREVTAILLGHVGEIFQDFRYRRSWSDGNNHALEFTAKVGDLDIVGVDLITTNDDGLITEFEVAARPYKTVGALREAMMARVMQDPRMLKFVEQLSEAKRPSAAG